MLDGASITASPPRLALVSLGSAAAVWGVAGLTLLLAVCVFRLVPVAHEALASGLSGWGWLATAGWLGFMAYFEGYKGFQRAFAPRVVARALHLARNPRPLHVLLAPLFCMALFHATRRRLVASWLLTAMVVVLVVAVRQLGQPWRGVIDAGVVVGLGWGVIALVAFGLRALAGRAPRIAADLPPA
jgi:hypothetical protein